MSPRLASSTKVASVVISSPATTGRCQVKSCAPWTRREKSIPIWGSSTAGFIARETVKAYRKDVTAKCYGGDISRKRKLLERQKEGKKRMKNIGRVEVPQEAFISALRLDD